MDSYLWSSRGLATKHEEFDYDSPILSRKWSKMSWKVEGTIKLKLSNSLSYLFYHLFKWHKPIMPFYTIMKLAWNFPNN